MKRLLLRLRGLIWPVMTAEILIPLTEERQTNDAIDLGRTITGQALASVGSKVDDGYFNHHNEHDADTGVTMHRVTWCRNGYEI